MCLLCGCFEIRKRRVGKRRSRLLCRCESCSSSSSSKPCVCKTCIESYASGIGKRCYELRIIHEFFKRDKLCMQIIHEVSKVWTDVCYDLIFLSESYVDTLYFRMEFTKRLRKHFGYSMKILIHRTPIAEVIAFIRSIRQHDNIIALADVMDGALSKILTDVMLEHWFHYPNDNEMVYCRF